VPERYSHIFTNSNGRFKYALQIDLVVPESAENGRRMTSSRY
jgi:hypothetical protein